MHPKVIAFPLPKVEARLNSPPAEELDDEETRSPNDETLTRLSNVAKQALANVLNLLNKEKIAARSDASDVNYDEAMATLALAEAEFVEPLNRNEVLVLAATLFVEHLGNVMVCSDVLNLTAQYQGRAMGVTVMYDTVRKLVERGLLSEIDIPADGDSFGRPPRAYTITELGRDAFRMSILTATLLKGKAVARVG